MKSKSMMTADEAKELLFDLAAVDPTYVDKIKQLSRYIDSLEDRANQDQPVKQKMLGFELIANSNAQRNREAHSQNPLFHKYQWTHTALLERHQGSEKSHLQVSRSDYELVIIAIQSIFSEQETLSTSEVLKQIKKTNKRCDKKLKKTNKRGDIKVPLTQLYLCLRYLKAAGLLAKCGGSYYRYTGPSEQLNFNAEASLIEKTIHVQS